MEKEVVVRFAPSPTGYLHIGGARTAIFNWLYARKHGGRFILRIEDTDAARSTTDSIQGIVDSLDWLGLYWDEGPNFQSRNIKAHLDAARTLVENGAAYKCFCSKEDLDEKRAAAKAAGQTYQYDGTCRHLTADAIKEKEAQGLSYAVRLKVPESPGTLKFKDAVYGTIEKPYQDLEDFIIVRSDQTPLYILSNAVDDINDRVTHVIRGQDGLANTPKQILIYQALGAALPVFAHMSLTLDPSKAKISKRRHGEMVAIHYYRKMGFLPWGLVNFLVLLGWATTDAREIFSKEELIRAFSLKGISKANAVFNIDQKDTRFITDPKALNINAHHLRSMPPEDLIPVLKPLFEAEGIWNKNYEADKKDWFLAAIDLLRDRFFLTRDFVTQGRAYFSDDFPMDENALETHLHPYPELAGILRQIGQGLSQLEDFHKASVESYLKQALKTIGIKPGILVNGIRVALTGQAKGPEFMDSLMLLGRERVLERLARAASLYG